MLIDMDVNSFVRHEFEKRNSGFNFCSLNSAKKEKF